MHIFGINFSSVNITINDVPFFRLMTNSEVPVEAEKSAEKRDLAIYHFHSVWEMMMILLTY